MLNRRSLLGALLALGCLLTAPAFAAGFTSERFTVRTEGSGSDVILIPGLGSSPRVWSEMIKAVPGHRYHLLHLAGFAGAAKGGNGEGAVSAPVVEEIARYIAAEKLDKPAVIGHSMGGTIGLMLASRHPQSISRLMVVDMIPFLGAMFGPPGTSADSIRPTADAILARTRAAAPAERRTRAETTIAGMVNTESMRAGAVEDSLGSDADVTARAFHELIVTDLMGGLDKIAVPTTVLYVVPKGVPMTEQQMSGYYKSAYARLKGVQLKYIADSAHFIMWDQPAVFQREVKDFLQ